MINDLIDLWYYIKSTKHIEHLCGWKYEVCSEYHFISIFTQNHLTTSWSLKVTVGNDKNYRRIFLTNKTVEVNDSKTYHWFGAHQGILTDEVCDGLMDATDIDEIKTLNCILDEMSKLTNRSENGIIDQIS